MLPEDCAVQCKCKLVANEAVQAQSPGLTRLAVTSTLHGVPVIIAISDTGCVIYLDGLHAPAHVSFLKLCIALGDLFGMLSP